MTDRIQDPIMKGRIEKGMRGILSVPPSALSHAFNESDVIFKSCVEQGIDPDEEFKRRIDEKIASLEPSDMGLLFILVSEFCFQCKKELLREKADQGQARDQVDHERTV